MKILWLAVLGLLITVPSAWGAKSVKAVQQEMTASLEAEIASQKEYQRWADKKEEMAQEIRNMKLMDSWLDFQNKKYSRYLEKQKAVIAELERRKQEAKRIKMELEPFLEDVVELLGQQVKQDLPFLADERSKRLAFLRESLDDYHLNLSEKLRRVLEALQVEAEYGRSVETTSEILQLNGSPVQVDVFRLGRLALFYRSQDNAQAGVWDRKSASWRPLDSAFAGEMKKAGEMATRKRAVEMLDLPIGGVL